MHYSRTKVKNILGRGMLLPVRINEPRGVYYSSVVHTVYSYMEEHDDIKLVMKSEKGENGSNSSGLRRMSLS